MSAVSHQIDLAADDGDGLRRRLWTIAEYERAGELGIFGAGEKLELIFGEVVENLSPQGPMHVNSVARTSRALGRLLPTGSYLRLANPVAVPPNSEPEPDISIVRGDPDDYFESHPTGSQVLLAVEVSDTSLLIDRGVKSTLYASAGIPEYWIVSIPDRRLEVHTNPSESGYGKVTILEERQSVSPAFASDEAIFVSDLLPRMKTT